MEEEEHLELGSPGEFWEYLAGVYGEDVLDEKETALNGTWSGRILVSGEAQSLQEIEAMIKEETANRTRLAAVDVSRITAPRSFLTTLRERTEDGFLSKAGWEKDLGDQAGLVWRRHSVVGLSGEPHSLRDAKVRYLVSGATTVSGGTTYALTEVADPTISTCGDGFDFALQADLDPARPIARLRIDGAETKILELRSKTLRYPTSVNVVTPGSADGPRAVGAAPPSLKQSVEIELTLPRQSVKRWNADRTIPLDRHAILAVQGGPGETAEVLIGRVRKVR